MIAYEHGPGICQTMSPIQSMASRSTATSRRSSLSRVG